MRPILIYSLRASIDYLFELVNHSDKSYIQFYWYSFYQIYMVLDERIRIMCWYNSDKIDIMLAMGLQQFSCNLLQAQHVKLN